MQWKDNPRKSSPVTIFIILNKRDFAFVLWRFQQTEREASSFSCLRCLTSFSSSFPIKLPSQSVQRSAESKLLFGRIVFSNYLVYQLAWLFIRNKNRLTRGLFMVYVVILSSFTLTNLNLISLFFVILILCLYLGCLQWRIEPCINPFFVVPNLHWPSTLKTTAWVYANIYCLHMPSHPQSIMKIRTYLIGWKMRLAFEFWNFRGYHEMDHIIS